MCGRYTILVSWDELMLRFMLDQAAPPYHRPKYNVAPGQMIMAIVNDGMKNRIGELKWGLVPHWAKDPKIGNQMLNARSETLLDKPAYKLPFERKRCLIPADGFYEWKRSENGKQPMRITMKDGGLFAMAALYDTWIAPDGTKIGSCSIVTTEPNPLVADIHDRMPVILRKDDEAIWLNRDFRDTRQLSELLKPYPAERMDAYPVSAAVGNVRNDEPALVARIAP